ncbi:hypothetical protein ACFQZJ_10305 [Maribacter chungangensis]|uniref:Lipocalin family protein n=1 Tax=Maribacter chungangensis TaxID=1069117 RepID=A0ABW3B5E4_9FLAO
MMKITIPFLVVFLLIGVCVKAQSDPITKFELYGRWVLELKDKDQFPEKSMCLPRSESDSIESSVWTDILFFANGQCKISSNSKVKLGFCANGSVDGRYKASWDYNEAKGVITITELNTSLKEFSETYPQEYAEFGTPEWTTQTKIKVIPLADNKIGLLKMAANGE